MLSAKCLDRAGAWDENNIRLIELNFKKQGGRECAEALLGGGIMKKLLAMLTAPGTASTPVPVQVSRVCNATKYVCLAEHVPRSSPWRQYLHSPPCHSHGNMYFDGWGFSNHPTENPMPGAIKLTVTSQYHCSIPDVKLHCAGGQTAQQRRRLSSISQLSQHLPSESSICCSDLAAQQRVDVA